ncbi:aldehyde-activating protein [Xanthomonas arboricola]|uniref:aldehyde-activating protein n=1 Tax=Xanthomonas arboricola TaxID=56448 RepID=UPI0007EC8249|nr:aldehyde-activating protein [Xanthomonas arboricola]OBR74647.1 aldehyde-activating protein [Xanthomonas arboricola]
MHDADSCHCGRIAFDPHTDAPITKAYERTCASCRRRGGLLRPGMRAPLRLQAAPEMPGIHRFNRQHANHHHFPQRGSAPFSTGVRCRTGEASVAVKLRVASAPGLAVQSMHAADGASR